MKTKLLLPLLLLTLSVGCTITKVPGPAGQNMWSFRLADWTKIGELSYSWGTNSVTMKGYDSDRQTAAVAAMDVAKEALTKVPSAP